MGGNRIEETNRETIIEKIGKIRLNLKHYPGEDYYCDGDVEDELLAIAKDYAQVEFPRLIEERRSWPILYHLSPLRENIVDWLPIDKSMKVLEVGSGCGAVTGALARKAGEVTCIDLSKKRSLINAYRHMDDENITIHVGNFQDIEPDLPSDYDYICLIGVLEYGKAYINSKTPYEDFLKILEKHRKKDGHIVIAIENKLGLKYWAGCKEDHLGTWFSSLEDYPEGGVIRTFTRRGLIQIARRCGFSEIAMYYPYPDYKFMSCLYSDERLPRTGELSSNLRNFDRERLQLFDEKLVYDTLIREGQYPLFANSFVMVLGAELPVKYAKYSNDRADEFKIRTCLTHRMVDGALVRQIEKHPLTDAAKEHIEQMYCAYEKLSERFAGGNLQINRCELVKEEAGSGDGTGGGLYAVFEYLEGKTMEELLDAYLEKNDMEGFQLLFDKYLACISYHEEMPITDYDLIFANILISADGQGYLIDYEWTFAKQMEVKEIAFRAIYCYLLENEKRNKLDLDLILKKLGITELDAAQYRQQEAGFQKYVTGRRMSMGEIREAIGQPVYSLSEFSMVPPAEKQKGKTQVYEDTGDGFNEQESYFLEENFQEEKELQLLVENGRLAVRIDPCSDSCIVSLRQLRWNDTPVSFKNKMFSTNGFRAGDGVFAFETEDPNFTLTLSGLEQKSENILKAFMQVTRMPKETIGRMKKKKGLF